MNKQAGFTLVELLVTVVIVAILASVALPNYTDYVTRGRIPEATSTLSDARVKMEQFFQDNRTYPTGGCVKAPAAPGVTQIQVPADGNFAFTCVAAANTFTVTATGIGQMAGFVYTIDQSNARVSTITKAGWQGNATCWVTKKGGAC